MATAADGDVVLFGTQRVNDRGHLEIGGCDSLEIVSTYGTPLYVIDELLIRDNCKAFKRSFTSRYPHAHVAYAGKAFLCIGMAKIIAEEGLHLDVASGGELYTAIKAEFPIRDVAMHGNFKSEAELQLALEAGVGRVVVDSIFELDQLARLAKARGTVADILIRTAPGVDPHTHQKISTGQADTKFGLNITSGDALAAVKQALAYSSIRLRGLHAHVGSQLLDTEAHVTAADMLCQFLRAVRDQTGFVAEELILGGGLGIRYIPGDVPPSIDHFVATLIDAVKSGIHRYELAAPEIGVEPGRSIVGEAGTTLYSVGPVKEVPIQEAPGRRTYVSVDGGLSDNPRPLMYDARYQTCIANRAAAPATCRVRVSGKHCETDTLLPDVALADPQPGDILAVLSTGAYNQAMASNYNRFTRPPVVAVRDGQARLLVRRETYEDIVRGDVI
jgi:diaminopimelate decarboxylase